MNPPIFTNARKPLIHLLIQAFKEMRMILIRRLEGWAASGGAASVYQGISYLSTAIIGGTDLPSIVKTFRIAAFSEKPL